ncbi:MAG: dehydrogenase [Gallionellales bacterium 35-53-114]|jgi:predicted dehydrogenase|nr:MAG: dehydrogenase [Gallionellales bacterium 35-53-114]OYZ63419.1 MAG: dehydrogenase [Gallionellales bacterium 24-53-125]OZB10968.1 MAG: dehydrogenase [Gallionellales bacterium 39-52-133]HQS58848.1 bi-domain-containing oxidoreductase [Gallionellaceae bacterium]HQS75767.1 bi-domain-containing oxidoreductase [Gallionellaceae bacterium]
MKQILQNLKNGETVLADIPCPNVGRGQILIQTRASLISAGTERMLVDFGKASMLDKARQQPEKVKMVLDKISTDGLFATLDAVQSKLGQPLPLGYCNVGVVAAVGAGVTEFSVGDRVASNGNHAEMVRVPKNLCAKIPDGVTDEAAAFTVLSAIALQGIRLVKPELGECVVVIGLGLIGLATVQLLRAQGCRVMGVDFDEGKLALARKFGAVTVNLADGEDSVTAAMAFSANRGVDAVLITAATKSNDPVSHAAKMSRKRGRIVLVGVSGLELNRSEFFEKELTFQVSCSYGPGRYDKQYEEGGVDYPIGFVRWTEQRNFEAVLAMLEDGKLDVHSLISHRIDFNDALQAYEVLSNERSALGIVLRYSGSAPDDLHKRTVLLAEPQVYISGEPVIGVLGAGNYASRVLIPAFKKAGAKLGAIVTSGGVSGAHFGKKMGFASVSTDETKIFSDPAVNTVVIATRHDSHANFVIKAIEAGKHVFVEKPLALQLDEIERIQAAWNQRASQGGSVPLLMVGFNRRFSPLIDKMKSLLKPVKMPKAFVYTCNAGAIPADHWTQNAETGGGRLVGEACHFVDLLRYLADSPISKFQVMTMGRNPALSVVDDKATISLQFEDGSIGTIHYFANGGKRFPKERLEVFAADAVLQMDNYRVLRGFGWTGFNKKSLWSQDKGQDACVQAFLDAVREGAAAPIPLEQIWEVSRLSVEIADAARQ